jgi:transcription termination factor Rho
VVGRAELAVVAQLRRALNGQDRRDAMRQLLDQLRTTSSNAEFLRRVALSLSQ